MRYALITACLLCVFLFNSGCATVPKALNPAERSRTFQADFEKLWSSTLEAVRMSNGKIITTDKPSGVVVYGARKDKSGPVIYANIYLKKEARDNPVTMFFVPKTVGGPCMEDIEKDFFDKLQMAVNAG